MSLTHCVECRAPLVDCVLNEQHEVSGVIFEVDVPAQGCTTCSESYVMHDVLARSELSIAHELGRLGVRTCAALVYMRKALGLSRDRLAAVMGMSRQAIQGWETVGPPEARAFAILAMLIAERIEGRDAMRQMLDASNRWTERARPTGPVKVTLA